MTTTFKPIDIIDSTHHRFNSSFEQIFTNVINNNWHRINGFGFAKIEQSLTTAFCDLLGIIDIVVDIECDVIDDITAIKCISIACLSRNKLSQFVPIALSYDITLDQVTF